MTSFSQNTLNKPMVSNLTGSYTTDGNHSIVYLNFSFVNQAPVDFFVPGNHNFTQDQEARFYIPHGKEKEFKKQMSQAPLINNFVSFHGMDSKLIGHYNSDRINNEGGGTLISNANNPLTITELNQKCFSKHQKGNCYYYVLDTLSFYSKISSEETMEKALIKDLSCLEFSESNVHLFVDNNFMSINGKFESFGRLFEEEMLKNGYVVHQSDNAIQAATQYVFGVKTPEMDISINEYINFDTSADVEFSFTFSENITTIPRSEGRISFQTSCSSQNDVKIISTLKGRVSSVTFMDETIELVSITGELEEEFLKNKMYCDLIFNNLKFVNLIDNKIFKFSQEQKNKFLLDNSNIIVNTLFCSPKSISKFDSTISLKLLDKLYEFSKSKVEKLVSKLSCENKKIYHDEDPHMLPWMKIEKQNNSIYPFGGRQLSAGCSDNNF